MTTVIKIGKNFNMPVLYICLVSNEVKPLYECQGKPILNGSRCLEVDTGIEYVFDEESRTWTEISNSGGGGISSGKVELVYDGTNITVNGEEVNFKQIVDFIKTDVRFTYLTYNNRVLLTSDMAIEGGTQYVFFETSTTDGGMSKNAVVKVYSADGVNISNISYSTTANENINNKVSTITENDKNSTVHYPSNKAMTEYADNLTVELTQEEYDAMVVAGTVKQGVLYLIPEVI